MRPAICLAALLPLACFGQIGEYDVEAAFLLNFTKFVEWPASAFPDAAAPFTICILGPNPFGRSLEEVTANETAAGRRLIVRHVEQLPVPQMCQILFVKESGRDLPGVLKAVPPGVLTVGNGDAFLRDGGMIQFVVENRRVRFDIHRSAAEKAALRLSSRLLSVARKVED